MSGDNVLQAGEEGSYSSLASKENPDNLRIVYIPALDLMLKRAEQLKNKLLSKSEKEKISKSAPAVAMVAELAEQLIAERGGLE